jgi:hypothetical protein
MAAVVDFAAAADAKNGNYGIYGIYGRMAPMRWPEGGDVKLSNGCLTVKM